MTIDQLIDELRRLPGWGATEQRLPALHNLRAALGVSPDIPYLRAGRIMRRELLTRIRNLDGDTYAIAGRRCMALQVRLALQVTLAYDQAANDAPTRRGAAMKHLGISKSVESWRRATGGEVELLEILAEHIGGEPIAA